MGAVPACAEGEAVLQGSLHQGLHLRLGGVGQGGSWACGRRQGLPSARRNVLAGSLPVCVPLQALCLYEIAGEDSALAMLVLINVMTKFWRCSCFESR